MKKMVSLKGEVIMNHFTRYRTNIIKAGAEGSGSTSLRDAHRK
jgi:Flp pilus assembly CpaF family ATPase